MAEGEKNLLKKLHLRLSFSYRLPIVSKYIKISLPGVMQNSILFQRNKSRSFLYALQPNFLFLYTQKMSKNGLKVHYWRFENLPTCLCSCKYPENFAFLILGVLELFTPKVCKFPKK